MQCTAKAKSTGDQCRRAAVAGRNVCTVHGGLTPRGLASPHTKTGRYSKDLPTRLAARYETAASDPDLLNLNAEIAVVDARISDVLRRVDTGESGQVWRDLKATYTAMQDAQRAKDGAEVARLLNELGGLIRHGHSDYAAWADVRTLIDQRRKLVESEGKRRKDMQDMITSEKAMVLVSSLVATVRKHVHDRDTLARISADLAGILGNDAG